MLNRVSLLLPLCIFVLAAACAAGGTSSVVPQSAPTPVNVNRLPDWFTNVPSDAATMYAAVTAESRDLQLAINKAITDGRSNLAQQMAVKFEGISKRFQDETGLGADAQLIDQFTQAYKAIVSQTINGSRAAKQEIVNTSAGGYRAYVLVELPIGQASQALMQRVRANEQMYTRFRASQAFDELQKEVERYETSQRPRP